MNNTPWNYEIPGRATGSVIHHRSEKAYLRRQTRKHSLNWLETRRIPSVHKYLVFLRALRNTYTPIGHLPPELLIEIFLICRSLSSPCDQSHARQWSCVCSQWRAVVISTSNLWSGIDLRNQNFAGIALERCQAGPISISLSLSARDEEEPLKVKLQRALEYRSSRIEHFFIQAKWMTVEKLIQILDTLPPRLNRLSIAIVPTGDSAKFMRDSSDKPPLPLRTLHLNMVVAHFNPATYENLIDLKLHNQLGQWAPDLDKLLDTLDACPKLVTLDLRFSGPTLPPETEEYPLPTRPVLEFAHLKTVSIEDESLVIGYLLAHIHVPRTAQLTLKFSSNLNNTSVWLTGLIPRIFPIDRTHFHHLTDITWFTYDSNLDIEVKFSVENLEIHLILEINPFEGDHLEAAEHFLVPFMDQFALDAVEKLKIVCMPNEGILDSEWSQVIPRLGALRTLIYQHWQEGLFDDFDVCGYLGQRPIVCPTLETLELCSLDFEKVSNFLSKERTEAGRFRLERTETEDLGMRLVECLRAREAQGNRLKELRVKDANNLQPEPETAELLEKCAVEIYYKRNSRVPVLAEGNGGVGFSF